MTLPKLYEGRTQVFLKMRSLKTVNSLCDTSNTALLRMKFRKSWTYDIRTRPRSSEFNGSLSGATVLQGQKWDSPCLLSSNVLICILHLLNPDPWLVIQDLYSHPRMRGSIPVMKPSGTAGIHKVVQVAPPFIRALEATAQPTSLLFPAKHCSPCPACAAHFYRQFLP